MRFQSVASSWLDSFKAPCRAEVNMRAIMHGPRPLLSSEAFPEPNYSVARFKISSAVSVLYNARLTDSANIKAAVVIVVLLSSCS